MYMYHQTVNCECRAIRYSDSCNYIHFSDRKCMHCLTLYIAKTTETYVPGKYLRYSLCRAAWSGTQCRAQASPLQLGAGWFSSHSFSTASNPSESVWERRRISYSLEAGIPSHVPTSFQSVTPSSKESRLGRVRVGSEKSDNRHCADYTVYSGYISRGLYFRYVRG